GTDNVPRVTRGSSGGGGLVLPPMTIEDLGVSFQQPALSIEVHGASVRLTSMQAGKVSAAINGQRGVRITIGDRTLDVETMAAAGDIDGQQLDTRDRIGARPGTTLRANGRMVLRGAETTLDLNVSGSAETGYWWAAFSDAAGPAGQLEGTARLTGLLSAPTIAF